MSRSRRSHVASTQPCWHTRIKFTEVDLPGWSNHISIVESILILLETTLLDISTSLMILLTLISCLEDNTVYPLSYMKALVDIACFPFLCVGPRGSPSFTCWSWNSLVLYMFLTCSFSFDQLLLFTRLVMFERRLLFVGVVPNVLLLALSPTISHANLKPK